MLSKPKQPLSNHNYLSESNKQRSDSHNTLKLNQSALQDCKTQAENMSIAHSQGQQHLPIEDLILDSE